MILSIDTECSGLDLYHGARPYFVTTCSDGGVVRNWQWGVNPFSREVEVDCSDVEEINELLEGARRVVMHHAKFDFGMLAAVGVSIDWRKVDNTLTASHVLASILPHGLDDLAIQYLDININKYEERIHEETEDARRLSRRDFPEWMIAKEGLSCMPSAKEKCWKYDMWLPQVVAREMMYPDNHPAHTALIDYATKDSEVTILLWPILEGELRRRGLWNVYRRRMRLPEIAHRMEKRGVTILPDERHRLHSEFTEESVKAEADCYEIAREFDYDLQLPKAGRNRSLDHFIFEVLKLPVLDYTEKDKPALNADCIEEYKTSLHPGSAESRFIHSLSRKTDLDKALSQMENHRKFVIEEDSGYAGCSGRCVLHPSFNTTGTVTTRWSSSNPNAQNVSKQSAANLRRVFGPSTGREWYSLDAANIELRIPAYEAGEQELIDIFERPDEPPYYGSYHLVIFDILYPDLFAAKGKIVKEPEELGGYASTLYQWVKNGNFARQYGAQERKVDATYGVPGAYRKIKDRFPKIDALNRKMIAKANRDGLVETLPSRLIDSRQGYPIMTDRTERGVSPTVPFAYHVSGTAGLWMQEAIIKVTDKLDEWREGDGFDGYLIIQVHDEQVLDFPKGKTEQENWWRVREIKRLMESCGDDLIPRIPTPVTAEYHPLNWSVGIPVT